MYAHSQQPGTRTMMGQQDPHKVWDRAQLQNKLNDMQVSIDATNMALSTKGPFPAGGSGPGSETGASVGQFTYDRMMAARDGLSLLGYDEAGNAVVAPSSRLNPDQQAQILANQGVSVDGSSGFGGLLSGGQIPPLEIDVSQLPILEGWVHKKGGPGEQGSFAGKMTVPGARAWKQRYCRIEGADLVFYGGQDDFNPRSRFPLDATTVLAPGDVTKRHKNRNVKYDFDLRNGRGETLSLYTETDEESGAWMYSIQTIITRLAEYSAAIEASVRGLPAAGFHQSGPHMFAGPAGGSALYPGDMVNGYDSASLSDSQAVDPALQQALADEALSHTAYGSGLYEAVRGEPAFFYIQANDAQGQPKGVGGDVFNVVMESEDMQFELSPVDNGDGTYYCEYTPTRPGEFQLKITYNGFEIYGSPFHPVISKAPTTASHCLVTGEGTSIARVGVTNTFSIIAKDQFDDERGAGGDNFEIEIHGPGLANPIVDHLNGVYTVSYDVDTESKAFQAAVAAAASNLLSASNGAFRSAPAASGLQLEIHITLNNEGFTYPRPVAGNPFRPRITLPTDAALSDPGLQAVVGQIEAESGLPFDQSRTLLQDLGLLSSAGGELADTTQVLRLKAELALKERMMQERLDALETAQKKLEEDRANVDKQMQRMGELGRKVKEDSERLAEQARTLRAVAGNVAAASATSPASPAAKPQAQAAGPASARRVTDDAVASSSRAQEPADAAPAELFDPAVVALFDKHKKPLVSLYDHYSSLSAGGSEDDSIDSRRFIDLFTDYDICPTFLTRKEVKNIFTAAAKAHSAEGTAEDALRLNYTAFLEGLGRAALVALSKPAFQHLYPSAREKVDVLLVMWGIADANKLRSVAAQKKK